MRPEREMRERPGSRGREPLESPEPRESRGQPHQPPCPQGPGTLPERSCPHLRESEPRERRER